MGNTKEGSLCGFLTPIYFFGFGKEQPFFQTTQSLSCAGALPLSNLFPGFSGACALLHLEAFPRFHQASAFPLGWSPFRLLCTCLIVLLLIPPPYFLPPPVKWQNMPVTPWGDCETAVFQLNQAQFALFCLLITNDLLYYTALFRIVLTFQSQHDISLCLTC